MAILKTRQIFLKKLKASSLMEVLVATVVLLIFFGIAITTLNNILSSTITRNTHKIETELNQLVYQYQNKQIIVPVDIEKGQWKINIQKEIKNNISEIIFKATHNSSNKIIYKKIIINEIK